MIGGYQPDSVYWIDTTAMLADCLTKHMTSTRLVNMLGTGILDLRAADEIIMAKMMKQKGRARSDALAATQPDSTEQ